MVAPNAASKKALLDQSNSISASSSFSIEKQISAGDSYGAIALTETRVVIACGSNTCVYDRDLNKQSEYSYQPATMVASNNGDYIYMSDESDDSFKKVRISDGNEMWSVSSSGWQQYNWMDKDANGNVVVPFYSDNEYRKYDSSGNQLDSYSISSSSRTMATSDDGNYVWGAGDDDNLRYFNSNLNQQCSASTTMYYGMDVFSSGSEEGYAAALDSNSNVAMFDTSCTEVWQESQNVGDNEPAILTLDGQVLAVDEEGVYVWDTSGNLVTSKSLSLNVFDAKTDLNDGYIYATGSSTYKILVNAPPSVAEGISFESTGENKVEVRATGTDKDGGTDFSSCTVYFRDRDGNTYSESGSIDSAYGGSQEARCRHNVTDINSYTGFRPGEEIEYIVQFTDKAESVNTTEKWHRNPNTYLKLDDSSDVAQSGVSVTAYQTETGTVASTGEDSTDECSGVTTDSKGWFSCGLAPNGDYDLKVNGIPRINDIDVEGEGTTRVLHYNQYDTGEFSDYEYLNLTAVNQTADRLSDANYSVRKAGTTKEFFMTEQNTDDGEIQVPLDQKEIYDVAIKTAKYQDDLLFRNVRVPDVIQAGFNQNFLPESTLANSLRFSAGHVLSAQTLVSRPFSNFDVVNVTVEKDLNTQFRLVSEVLVKQYNKTAGMTEACSVQPDSSTYFFIDEAECPLLNKINVSQDEWFRLDYRFRIPGPENFTSPGATNQYNVSDTIVRFDVL